MLNPFSEGWKTPLQADLGVTKSSPDQNQPRVPRAPSRTYVLGASTTLGTAGLAQFTVSCSAHDTFTTTYWCIVYDMFDFHDRPRHCRGCPGEERGMRVFNRTLCLTIVAISWHSPGPVVA